MNRYGAPDHRGSAAVAGLAKRLQALEVRSKDDPLSLTAVFANGKLIVLKSTHESATREGVA